MKHLVEQFLARQPYIQHDHIVEGPQAKKIKTLFEDPHPIAIPGKPKPELHPDAIFGTIPSEESPYQNLFMLTPTDTGSDIHTTWKVVRKEQLPK